MLVTPSDQDKAVLRKRKRFRIREPFSSLSHSAGAGFSIAALVILLIVARGRPWHTAAFAIYGATLILLYTASALYHSIHASPSNEARLQRFDHIAIFLLIAGTYTPLCLVTLRGAWGWSLLGIEYGLALIGIACSLFWRSAPDWVRVVIYICMGWLVIVAFVPVRHLLPPGGIAWLVAGGLFYTFGTVIFATDRPHLWPGKFSAHDLWHIFVLGGSTCHFILMLCYVAPSM